MFDSFNRLLSTLILFLWSLVSPLLPTPATSIQQPVYPERSRGASRIATPSAKLATPAAPSSALISLEKPSEKSVVTTTPVPWGTTEKIGDHLYRTYVGSDPTMGTPDEILSALNNYRKTHGTGELHPDGKLCELALRRAQEQDKMSTLDSHKGLIDYMNDENHWRELNITAIGENASYGYILSGVHLIEWIFDSDEEHKSNQLNPNWNLACGQSSGATVDIIFGKR